MVDIDIAQLADCLDHEVAASDWLEITQERIDQFAEATDDHQWIHVNPAKAATESPFHTTIAHGFLTLSLVSVLAQRAMNFKELWLAVNYGVNRVRFVTPVPAGAHIRGHFTPLTATAADGGLQVTWKVDIEQQDSNRPCCVIEWIVRYYPITRIGQR